MELFKVIIAFTFWSGFVKFSLVSIFAFVLFIDFVALLILLIKSSFTVLSLLNEQPTAIIKN